MGYRNGHDRLVKVEEKWIRLLLMVVVRRWDVSTLDCL
jgi:hypothetical protein